MSSSKAATPRIPAILRPNNGASGHVTMIWIPEVELVELVYQNGELKYAVYDRTNLKYLKTHGSYSPPAWLANAVQKRIVLLPSEALPFTSLDELAERMKTFIHRYLECDEAVEYIGVLYALHTWIYERFNAVPYLRFLGIWGTGKSRATDVVGNLCYRPVWLSGASSAAALYRIIEPIGGTLLIDEADFSDTQVGTDIAKILNNGYQQPASVWKTEKNTAGEFIPTSYDVYGPKIINGRRAFRDEATESRCLTYQPKKKTRTDIPVQLPQSFASEALEIRNHLLDWRLRNFETFDAAEPARICAKLEELGITLQPRTMQITGPLLTVAMRLRDGGQYMKHLLEFANANEGQSAEVLRESLEATIVTAFTELTTEGATPTCGSISTFIRDSKATEDPELVRKLSPRTISRILRELGFQTTHTKKGAVVTIEPERLQELVKAYGIENHDGKTPDNPKLGQK